MAHLAGVARCSASSRWAFGGAAVCKRGWRALPTPPCGVAWRPSVWSIAASPRSCTSSTRFTATHEWLRADGEHSVLGISDHAQSLLGEVYWCELPPPGAVFRRQEVLATLEGMRHPEASGEESGAEPDEEAAYCERGWKVQEVTVGRLGNMRTVIREVYAPTDCVVVEANARLEREGCLVNTAAEGEGWLVRLRLSTWATDLMDASAYLERVKADTSQ
eukprot:CAMPEP_0179201212 /NCGR_PEP_ID=MMETSP0796-20121207/100140_1 /TAXON_ID=73915 /ORGANISM="Pyrodinium bahamense, Strain pbaha01" /LENGTH=218 /DNA_ID=CAMNT_0020905769 /DNA_START=72 /DNA_END=728 /DNA_ORIENTATION=-